MFSGLSEFLIFYSPDPYLHSSEIWCRNSCRTRLKLAPPLPYIFYFLLSSVTHWQSISWCSRFKICMQMPCRWGIATWVIWPVRSVKRSYRCQSMRNVCKIWIVLGISFFGEWVNILKELLNCHMRFIILAIRPLTYCQWTSTFLTDFMTNRRGWLWSPCWAEIFQLNFGCLSYTQIWSKTAPAY